MQPGVDHQPRRAERLPLQVAEAAGRIAVQAQLEAQRLGIQRPAFVVGGEAAAAAKARQPGQLHRAGNLQVMAGHRLVRDGGLHLPQRAGAIAVRVDVDPARPAAVQRRALVVGRGVGREVQRHRPQAVGRARQFGKQARQFGVDALGHVAPHRHQRGGAVGEVARVGVQVLHEGGKVAFEAHLARHGLHLAAQPGHLAQAQRMHLGRTQ